MGERIGGNTRTREPRIRRWIYRLPRSGLVQCFLSSALGKKKPRFPLQERHRRNRRGRVHSSPKATTERNTPLITTDTVSGVSKAFDAVVPPASTAGQVFLSYSRKDYYFAESLAFHLERAGVPVWLDATHLTPGSDWAQSIDAALAGAGCVILVVSPDSVRSAQVRAEWQRARRNGQRIVLALFRPAAIPDELSNAVLVDFRGRFKRAVRTLIDVVSNVSRPSVPRPGLRPAVVPPSVVLVALILGILWVAFIAAGIAFGDFSDFNTFWWYVWLAAVQALFLYHIGLAFLRRRMSMARLASCFAIYCFIFGYPVLEVFVGRAVPPVYPPGMLQFVRDHWMLQGLLLGTAATGVIILTVLRPADLLRWAPTGKAWSSYRRWHYHVPVDYDPSGTQVLTRIHAFRVICDKPDEPAGRELRRRLVAAGAQEREDGTETTAVLLLTNRTRLTWLLDQVKTLPVSLVTFVGSGLDLREEFGELWKRQWVDARNWRVLRDHTALQKRDSSPSRISLPALPEALTRTILPSHVSRVHHVSVSLAMLSMFVAMAANPGGLDEAPRNVAEALRATLVSLSMVTALSWLGLSHQFVVRLISEHVFYDRIRVVGPFTLILGLINLALYWNAGGHPIRVAPCVAALLVAPVVLLRMRSRLTSWFPSVARESHDVSLAPAGAWRRTALVALIHMMLWASVLNPDI